MTTEPNLIFPSLLSRLLLSSSPGFCYKSIPDSKALASGSFSFAFLISSNFCIFQQQWVHLLCWPIAKGGVLLSCHLVYVYKMGNINNVDVFFSWLSFNNENPIYCRSALDSAFLNANTHIMKEIHQVACFHSKTSALSNLPFLY